MRVVRRLYFYLVALISLEVIVWGVINLARTLFQILPSGGTIDQLATGLSLVLVGLPVFVLHWTVVQRDARRDEEERAARLRSLFLYSARFALLAPVIYSLLAIVSRAALSVFGYGANQALIGAGQTFADNIVAVAANLVAWVYMERTLRAEWQVNLAGSDLAGVRRLYRYAWVLYSLILLISGMYFVIRFILYSPEGLNNQITVWLANGIALAFTGAPLFTATWLTIQRSLPQVQRTEVSLPQVQRTEEPPQVLDERQSTLRLAVLYLISLTGAVYTLISLAFLAFHILRWVFGQANTLQGFLNDNSAVFAMGANMAVLWAYFGQQRRLQVDGEPDLLRRAGLERLYRYMLVLLGNAVTLLGLWQLTNVLIDMLLTTTVTAAGTRDGIAQAIGNLIVGLPLWLRTWPQVQAEAAPLDTGGDHARRSVVRKVYLYLVLFGTVVGVMVSGGALLFHLLSAVLGRAPADFWTTLAHRTQTVVIVALWLVYHLAALRQDGRKASEALTNRHALFPALILAAGDDGRFADEVAAILQRQAPRLPVTVHRLDQGSLNVNLSTARVLVLPAALAAQPPEALRAMLKDFNGQRIVVPLPLEPWIWLSSPVRSTHDLAMETARAVRNLAEGQAVRPAVSGSPWVIVGYVLSGLFGVQLLFVLFALAMSFINR